MSCQTTHHNCSNAVLFDSRVIHAGIASQAGNCKLSLSFIPYTIIQKEIPFYKNICKGYGLNGLGLKRGQTVFDRRKLE